MDLFIGGPNVNIIAIALVEVMIVCAFTTAAVPSKVDAQANDLSTSKTDKNKTPAVSSGGSIDVSLEATPNPVRSGEENSVQNNILEKEYRYSAGSRRL